MLLNLSHFRNMEAVQNEGVRAYAFDPPSRRRAMEEEGVTGRRAFLTSEPGRKRKNIEFVTPPSQRLITKRSRRGFNPREITTSYAEFLSISAGFHKRGTDPLGSRRIGFYAATNPSVKAQFFVGRHASVVPIAASFGVDRNAVASPPLRY